MREFKLDHGNKKLPCISRIWLSERARVGSSFLDKMYKLQSILEQSQEEKTRNAKRDLPGHSIHLVDPQVLFVLRVK